MTSAPETAREEARAAPPEPAMTAKEYAGVLRDMIKHENDLTNHRLGWMSTLNGLMLTGLGFIWGKPYDQIVICVFCVLGLFACYTAHLSLRAADLARASLNGLWLDKKVPDAVVPPVIGRAEEPSYSRYLLPWKSLPAALALAWVVLLVVNLLRPKLPLPLPLAKP